MDLQKEDVMTSAHHDSPSSAHEVIAHKSEVGQSEVLKRHTKRMAYLRRHHELCEARYRQETKSPIYANVSSLKKSSVPQISVSVTDLPASPPHDPAPLTINSAHLPTDHAPSVTSSSSSLGSPAAPFSPQDGWQEGGNTSSDSTVILETKSLPATEDTSVPALQRAESVFLTSEMLASTTRLDSENYCPCSVSESDTGPERGRTRRREKRRVREKGRKTAASSASPDTSSERGRPRRREAERGRAKRREAERERQRERRKEKSEFTSEMLASTTSLESEDYCPCSVSESDTSPERGRTRRREKKGRKTAAPSVSPDTSSERGRPRRREAEREREKGRKTAAPSTSPDTSSERGRPRRREKRERKKNSGTIRVTRHQFRKGETEEKRGRERESKEKREREKGRKTAAPSASPDTSSERGRPRRREAERGRAKRREDRRGRQRERRKEKSGVSVMKFKKNGKKHYCLFCHLSFSKIARHLEARHGSIPEVKRAVTLPKGSKQRRLQLNLLRNRGNRIHNNKVLQDGRGVMIPSQQSREPVNPNEYMHCINCEALLKRKALWRHMKRCQLAQRVGKPGKTRVQALCAYMQPVPSHVNKNLWKLVNDMNQDEVTETVRGEKWILRFGEKLYSKHGHDVTKHEYIRQKMRETGRLIQKAKSIGHLKTTNDFFVPANFSAVVEAVKAVADFNEDQGLFKTPSLALKLGHNLKKLADIVECEAMMSEDENTLHNVRTFKRLYEARWNESVATHALRNLNEARWNAPTLLPFTEDVKKMHHHIDEQRMEFHTKLLQSPNKKSWSDLANLTLCEIILFNRRREGEVAKMPLKAFTVRDTSSTHPDIELGLSAMEKKLCQHFQRIEIQGKRQRKVAILITPKMLSSMQALVQSRLQCGVPEENIFMFARPEAMTHFRGSDAIRNFARKCGAKHPEALSSTKLRKHVATMSKVLNLKDNEMDDMADFLGHDIRVHRQFYRLPEGTLQLAKISKVLLALERGKMSEFKGKNLEEISIDPNEEMAVDSDPSEDEVDQSISTAGSSRKRKSTIEVGSDTDQRQTKVRKMAKTKSRNNQLPADDDESLDGTQITKGSSKGARRMWSAEEVQAVERHLMDNIKQGKVPGKAQCETCIKGSAEALRGRTWRAVKYYIKNRIESLKHL